ncbi:putative phosphatase [Klebsiella pneumoniae subsp. ozaenae]|uniref:Putative phosphatase n=1 Tax=Klebsiella pneumoniae subsp. ozaenae TaxID=574 RepID=A0A377Z8U2_KLEPO|nr:putative phosphatase [Klebsiella pneumoniae subsp. ozaenae]
MQCKGFLFDLDGTLVDSLPVVERSWCKWGDRFAIDHDEILSFIHGKQAITSIRHFIAGAQRGGYPGRISLPRADRSH